MPTIFAKIIRKEIPADILYEDENIIAFKDIAPVAPVHILIVTKKLIKDLQSLEPEDFYLVSEIAKVAQILAKQFNVEDGYRLITNNGANAGQAVFHLHFHLVGGAYLGGLIGAH